jgi:hypothetical protein
MNRRRYRRQRRKVESDSPTDDANKAAIRRHMQKIAGMFAEGDFSIPMFIHETVPPGVEVTIGENDAIRVARSRYRVLTPGLRFPAMIELKSFRPNSKPIIRLDPCRIRSISEDKAKLLIACEDGSTLAVTLIDSGNSVSVRDKNDQVEYLG